MSSRPLSAKTIAIKSCKDRGLGAFVAVQYHECAKMSACRKRVAKGRCKSGGRSDSCSIAEHQAGVTCQPPAMEAQCVGLRKELQRLQIELVPHLSGLLEHDGNIVPVDVFSVFASI